MKKITCICALCLLLGISLIGCSEQVDGSDSAADPISSGSDTNDYIGIDVEQPQDTDTDTRESTTEADTDESTVPPDTETEAVTEAAPETDAETAPVTDTEEETEESTQSDDAAEVRVPVNEAEIIDLSGVLTAGNSVKGQFISHQSEKIYLAVSYDCRLEEDGGVTVELEVGLQTYDINCGPRADTGKITVDGVTHTFSTDAIVHEERTSIYVPFTTYSHRSTGGKSSINIDVSWLFNGTYAGVKLDTLTASAEIRWDASSADTPDAE